jgi:fibro-slime domain-containing protein
MSWSFNVRVLGVGGLWLLALQGCGGDPSVQVPSGGSSGAESSGGTAGSGKAGSSSGGLDINPIGGKDGTGGSDTPQPTYECGNGELEPGEFCDDGNTDDDDGCSADCATVDGDFDCSVVGKPCVQVVICGNGVLEGDELCDDGNVEDGDGCPADCSMPEEGYGCVRPGEPCVVLSICGNGVRERGERCDDGQMPPAAGDGCDDLCKVEADDGYYCPIPGQPCVKQVCGDGVRTRDEVCDDGNTLPGDGCAANCKMVETGWHCNALGCKAECGDGLRVTGEDCDDNNATSGDGCSAGCKEEPFFTCNEATPSSQSVCTSTIACGNGVVEPGEVCDTTPPGSGGCKLTCDGYNPLPDVPECGDDVIEGTEKCEPPMPNAGCSDTCQVEAGWTCPQPGFCFPTPKCGDGIVQADRGETCDDGDLTGSDGCDAACKVEGGWTCVGLGPSTCVKPVCGNSIVEAGETCDDGTAGGAQDGCFGCATNPDYVCPAAGQACQPRCGDGKKVGLELCDDGNKVSGDGCNAGCKIEPGFKCPTAGAACIDSVCGDDIDDAGEGCDDGNLIAGDGCGPTCQKEPTVTLGPSPTVNVFCGDGLKTGIEDCDDGNLGDGDGCDSNCEVEDGWSCSGDLELPSSLQMRVTYRDFKINAAPNGHPHFENDNADDNNKGMVGQPCTAANQATTCGRLDSAGKPQAAGTFSSLPGGAGATGAQRFSTWYQNTNTLGFDIAVVTDSLTLTQIGGATSEVYEYQSAAQFPLNLRGLGNTCGSAAGSELMPVPQPPATCPPGERCNTCCNAGGICVGRNYTFTTELRYFFQYQGGETLTFRGDDDVWVFINGRLAVDVGGVHCAEVGRVILGDADSTCSVHGADYTNNNPNGNWSQEACRTTGDPPACALSGAEQASTTDSRFGLTKGNVYEIVLFHAERHTIDSNFRLTLAGFLAPRSFCESDCGDGIVVGDEFCDDGASNSDTVSGACKTDCTARNFCGDGVRQLPGEACDNGTNTDLYKTAMSAPTVCAPGCKVPASCGDGTLQPGNEQCDKGAQNDDASYGKNSCKTDCKLGGYCGDGTAQTDHGETCDLGNNNGKTYGAGSCGYDCQPGKRCGDGAINDGSEQCDDGVMNGSIGSHCSTLCKLEPYCGDGKVLGDEQCDHGQFAHDPPDYGGCTLMCTWGPQCGDGALNDPPEECDDGAANNDATYDGCTTRCALGPRCGDGVKQPNESCDNGFNADDYDDPQTPQAECGMNCTAPPTCGDGELQSFIEYCDYGTCEDANDPKCNRSSVGVAAYGGCNDHCEFGPFCGDGTPQTGVDAAGNDITEDCDDGVGNVSYLPEMGGCGYDCRFAPWCGDGVRNGPEQCDDGAMNTGEYGMCNPDCTFGDRCGDNVKQGPEECDDGQTGSLTCTPTCKRRIQVQ